MTKPALHVWQYGLTIGLDESGDPVSETEPVNVIIITSSACYFVDTFFVPDERADTDKYGDSFGKAFVQWWDNVFIPYEGKDAPPLRDDVSAIVTDNVNYNVGAFRRHWKPRFTKAHHIRCLAHILNLVGMHFREHRCLYLLREFMSKTCSVLKGKKNIRRRRRLRKFLMSQKEQNGEGITTIPPDWADTRWSGWYDSVVWFTCGLGAFRKWLQQEVNTPDCLATLSDLDAWLQVNGTTVRLQLTFVKEHAKDIFGLLQPIQVSVAATHAVTAKDRRPKPHMHRVYNQMHELYVTLQTRVDSKSLGPATEDRLERKTAAGQYLYAQRQRMRADFLDVVRQAKEKLWKYVSKHMDFAKQARVVDPRQIARLSPEITQFPDIFPSSIRDQVVDSGEWNLYRESIQPDSQKFDLLQWWESMAPRLPIMYACARRTLAIPHTSCDVERSFSVWKRVRSDKQYSMQEGTHKAYVSFCFNGVVPEP